MPLFNKALDTITESDLDTLIVNHDSEAKTVEYKEQLPNWPVAKILTKSYNDPDN